MILSSELKTNSECIVRACILYVTFFILTCRGFIVACQSTFEKLYLISASTCKFILTVYIGMYREAMARNVFKIPDK